MANTKVAIYEDELHPFYRIAGKSNRYSLTVEIDSAIAERWNKIMEEFKQAQKEMSEAFESEFMKAGKRYPL